jgi:histidinol dehydrogenase
LVLAFQPVTRGLLAGKSVKPQLVAANPPAEAAHSAVATAILITIDFMTLSLTQIAITAQSKNQA